ncbi:hypothetical protein C8R41DRAFT_900871 [Lentinula lateritia]|uniref:Uncharacterized protein n=1 Tax=Lentinula lateritia TaxID=40482 RepID=A0ABQ8VR45_9AGAR|nr:hypothetical protein C8R41DRAFT_900871 [Lentinula lateritia]
MTPSIEVRNSKAGSQPDKYATYSLKPQGNANGGTYFCKGNLRVMSFLLRSHTLRFADSAGGTTSGSGSAGDRSSGILVPPQKTMSPVSEPPVANWFTSSAAAKAQIDPSTRKFVVKVSHTRTGALDQFFLRVKLQETGVVEEIHPVDLTDEEVVSEGFEANYPKFDELSTLSLEESNSGELELQVFSGRTRTRAIVFGMDRMIAIRVERLVVEQKRWVFKGEIRSL